ncbi:sigma-70 family RNA polymerase sigma factor [Streptomyces albiaxialis]|uniref:Sigma-70 family RNA polymerase sigma factor n=1 Tax=Streptomyces albiaxialis TaxID=329523 RepID=A0ABN2W2T7_9ACTN
MRERYDGTGGGGPGGDGSGGDGDALAARFEEQRGSLRAAAYRMLGSLSEADDAVQETWIRLARTDVSGVRNLAAWLRTVLSRVCLDLLRARAARREELTGAGAADEEAWGGRGGESADEPEDEAVLADAVGRALLVVLDTLGPEERVAFVLHDTFAVPFDEIAPLVDRSPVAAKKLASRARHRVRGTSAPGAAPEGPAGPVPGGHRQVVDAFLAAARTGDLDALLGVLAPDVVRRADPALLPSGRTAVLRGARAVAEETRLLARNARFAGPALVDGAPALVVAPHGRLRLALRLTIEGGRVAAYEVIADPARLARLVVTVPEP